MLSMVAILISFLSTLSLRRATAAFCQAVPPKLYFYPRSPCGERRWLRCWQLAARDISIHALLAESDDYYALQYVLAYISIHALLAESDGGVLSSCSAKIIFLSTLSLRRATVASLLAVGRAGYFYPRSPCGERRLLCFTIRPCLYFYPRSPCGERPFTTIITICIA